MAALTLALLIMIFWRWNMAKPSAVTVFLAASSLLLASADLPVVQAQDGGGLKEWSTDQAVDDDSLMNEEAEALLKHCLLYTSPSPRDRQKSRMPSSA